MKVAVIGAGYVGLITALGLARLGRQCVCVEKNPARLSALRRGEVFFHEPGVPELLAEVRRTDRFSVTDDLDAALVGAEVAMIAVGTPSNEAGIDLTDVRAVAAEVGARLARADRYVVVAVKSTVIPGSTDGAVREEIERASSLQLGEFGLAMTPEFLREGSAVSDFLNPDRIVIGAADDRAAEVVARLFEGFACPVLRTTLRNAEMIKYASNALLACLVSFSNEVARVCERCEGLDEETVMRGVHLDRRFSVSAAGAQRAAPALPPICAPASATAAPASPRMYGRWRRSSAAWGSSRTCLPLSAPSTRRAPVRSSTSWSGRCAGARQAFALPFSASRSSPIPTTSASRRGYAWRRSWRGGAPT